ncbi:MAG TPA: DNA mismatch repair endonuclease MutL [bacterium]
MPIRILDDVVINQIAAGEVVERPASVVKELVENAIDAGASRIDVDLAEGGCGLIRVVDNGSGIPRDEIHLAFARHGTSKLVNLDGLQSLHTLGFRGEALPSIAAVAEVTLATQPATGEGGLAHIAPNRPLAVEPHGRARGTAVEVRDLFTAVPARRKFLKTERTELHHVVEQLTRLALARPDLRLSLTHGKRRLLDLAGDQTLKQRLFAIKGDTFLGDLLEFHEEIDGITLRGLLTLPGREIPRSAASLLFVNGRPVTDRLLRHAVNQAHETLVMRHRQPFVVLFVDLPPAGVDVNVHPAKAEVRFRDPGRIHALTRSVLRDCLQGWGRVEALVDPAPGPVRAALSFASPRGGPPWSREPHRDYRPTLEAWREMGQNGAGSAPDQAIGQTAGPTASADPGPFTDLFGGGLTPIGQLRDTYILAEDAEGLVLVDQHAAHERILYHRLQEEHTRGARQIQGLLFPETVELPTAQAVLLEEEIHRFRAVGIDVDPFGERTFTVRALPAIMAGVDLVGYFERALAEIAELESAAETARINDQLLFTMACRSAIKAHHRLTAEEIRALLSDLRDSPLPFTCEHGRPTLIRIPLGEIERRFKRQG